MIPRDTGIDPDGAAETEADHFMRCPACGEWFDMRDLAQMIQHVHDADIVDLRAAASAGARRAAAVEADKRTDGWLDPPAYSTHRFRW